MKTFAEHLQELKVRLIAFLAVLGVGSIIGFMLHKPIEALLQRPLNQTLYYSNPAGGLSFVMQIALAVGMLLALPMLLFQLMQFSRPALKPLKTQFVLIILASSLVLTILAIVYAYAVSLPSALHFLVTFNSDGVKALISVNDYMKFLFAYLSGTVLAFQLPLILFFANKIRRFPPGGLLKLQRPAIVGAVVFAGVVTPTVDPINQLLVAMPIIALFEVGALTVVISNKINKPLPVFEIKRPAQLIPLVIEDQLPVRLPVRRKIVVETPIQTATKVLNARGTVPVFASIELSQTVVPIRSPRRKAILDILGPVTPALG